MLFYFRWMHTPPPTAQHVRPQGAVPSSGVNPMPNPWLISPTPMTHSSFSLPPPNHYSQGLTPPYTPIPGQNYSQNPSFFSTPYTTQSTFATPGVFSSPPPTMANSAFRPIVTYPPTATNTTMAANSGQFVSQSPPGGVPMHPQAPTQPPTGATSMGTAMSAANAGSAASATSAMSSSSATCAASTHQTPVSTVATGVSSTAGTSSTPAQSRLQSRASTSSCHDNQNYSHHYSVNTSYNRGRQVTNNYLSSQMDRWCCHIYGAIRNLSHPGQKARGGKATPKKGHAPSGAGPSGGNNNPPPKSR